MNWSGAWKWAVGFATTAVAARINLLQAVISILLVLAVASAIVFSFALFFMDLLEGVAGGLEFLARRVRHAANGAHAMLAHWLHQLSTCGDPRQGFFLLLPVLMKPIGKGIRRLLQWQERRGVGFVLSARKDHQQLTVSREFR